MAGYRIGVTSELTRPDGSLLFGDIGLDRLVDAGLKWEQMPAVDGDVPPVGLVARYDAVLAVGHLHFPREVVAAAPRLRHVARFGAGYDGIDLDGLAAEGVVVTNTPTAVRRPLAVAALTLLLAQAHRLAENHRAAAEGRWADRGRYRGAGVVGRTVGILGFGAVGAELAELLLPLGVRVVASNRSGTSPRAAELGVEMVPTERLAAESDYVVVTAALTPSSHHLVDEAFLAAMRPTAHLVNVARGGVVDQAALTAALAEGRLAGAALDVLDPEPPAADDPLLTMPDVVVTPHALCWTADFTREVSAGVVQALVDVAHGRRPEHLLNPGAWDRRRG
ncbi:D-isomer specific 2-hydroxyacid dehydrogenase family protein [Actinotalea sp. AC32]|nr:D-isomer specific 2-hydroxyacid dehydrogenase family protein [Actinotalea sp. AC32]